MEALIEKNAFPRFSILVGPKGCGKKTACKWLVDALKHDSYTLPDIKIDTIRQMMDVSYKAIKPIVYLIQDADGMSTAAKNSLLKVTEEPPNNAYFIMTLEDENNTLDTIKSRANVFHLNNYTKDEIIEYARRESKLTSEEIAIIDEVCTVPGDVDMLCAYKPVDFYKYVEQVVKNIAEVEGANAFKISDKLAIKNDDANGYDIKLFLRAFMSKCVMHMGEDPFKYVSGVSITNKYINQLGIKGVSKQMLIDAWILEIRKAWLK